MSMPQSALLQRLQEEQRALAAKDQGQPPLETSSGVRSFALGAAQGLLEPLGFLPPVQRFMEAHLGEGGGQLDPRGANLGRALGFLAGFAVPLGASYKIVGYGARALKLVESADALAELSAVGKLARGSVAGAMLGAGQSAEDAPDRIKHMAAEAAMFGLGDVAFHGLGRAWKASGLGGKFNAALAARFNKMPKGPLSDEDANLVGNALKVANTFIDEEAVGKSGIRPRVAALQFTLEKAGFDNMQPGTVAILPGFGDEASDIRGLLRRWKEVEYRTVSYVSKIDGSLNEQILVARKGDLNPELVKEFTTNAKETGKGFVAGQRIRQGGADWVVTGPGSQPGTARGYIPGRVTGAAEHTVDIPLENASVMPMVAWRHGPTEIKGAAKHWGQFVEQFGQFPEQGWLSAFERYVKSLAEPRKVEATAIRFPGGKVVTGEADMGHEAILTRMVKNGEITPEQVDAVVEKMEFGYVDAKGKFVSSRTPSEFSVGRGSPTVIAEPSAAEVDKLKEYFALRTMENLANVDEPLGRALKRIKELQGYTQPESSLAITAAQHGYLTYPDVLEDGRRVVAIRDVLTGQTEQFATAHGALKRITSEARDLPDFLPPGVDPPFPMNYVGFKASSVVPAHTAVEVSGWKGLPRWLVGVTNIFPRYEWLRMTQEVADRELGKAAPQFFGPFSRLIRAQNISRLKQQPFAVELKKLWDYQMKMTPDDMERLTAVLEEPRGYRRIAAQQQKLSPQEFEIVNKLDDFIRRQMGLYIEHRFPGNTATKKQKEALLDEFFNEYYYPFIRRKKPVGSGKGNWLEAVEAHFAAMNREPAQELIQLGTEMERAGLGPGRFENNPFMTALRFMTTVHTKIHVTPAFNAVRGALKALPETGDLQLIKHSLEDYLKATYSGSPEAYYIIRKFSETAFESLGIELEPKDMDKLINTMVSLNYGAFMAFRPALAVRNLVQSLSVTLPMIQDPIIFAKGIKLALTKEGRDAAREAGAVPIMSVGQPLEDQAFRHSLAEGYKTAGSWSPRVVDKAVHLAEKAGKYGLGTEPVEIGGKKFWVGFYSRADELNRAIAFHAQRLKALKALDKYHVGLTAGDAEAVRAFNKEAGLTFFGSPVENEFHRIATQTNRRQAIDWLGTMAANETQWVYQMGAGPALFSHGVGRLFGMYGTWPSWYAAHLYRGAQRFKGDAVGAAKFWGWTAAVWGSVPAVGAAMGLNFSKWSGLSSFTWSGGPAWDWFKDASDIISGSGDETTGPTAGRLIALSKYGLKDYGNQSWVPYLGYLDPREESGFDIANPGNLALQVLDYFTPGILAFKDAVVKAPKEGNLARALARAAGFQPVPGHSWPNFEIR